MGIQELALCSMLLGGCIAHSRAALSSQPLIIQAERYVWCGPGWKGTFTSTGAHQHVSDTCIHPSQSERDVPVTSEQWNGVIQALALSKFEELPELVPVPVNADGTISILTDDD